MGLLGDVSDDDDDDDDHMSPTPASSAAPKGKNQALLEAISGSSPTVSKGSNGSPALPPSSGIRQAVKSGAPPHQPPPAKDVPVPQRQDSDTFRDRPQPPQSQPRGQPQATRPSAEHRRPPGLTIPPAAATTAQLATSPQFPSPPLQAHQQQQLHATPPIDRAPSPAVAPRDIPARVATSSPMPAPRPQRPAPAFMITPTGSPVPSSPAPPFAHTVPVHSPMLPTTPLQLPPSTPITPLFAAPPPSVLQQGENRSVSFSVMRGESEGVLLERTREKNGSDDSHMSMGSRTGLRNKARNDGDDFWRRFSMVAHQAESNTHNPHKRSSWLAKAERNAQAYSRWVAIGGVLLLCLIGAGIASGIYLNKGKGNGHADPLAIGGKANESDISTPTSTSATLSTKRTGYLHQTMTTSDGNVFPVPTNPPRRRGIEGASQPTPTPTPALDAIIERLQSPPEPLADVARRHHEQDRRQHRNRQLI
jgi:hypothetical protein